MKIDAKESLPRFAIYLMLVAFVMVTCLVIMPSEASATSWPVAVDSDCPDGAEEGDVCGEESVTGTCQGSFPGDTELTCTADTSDPTAEDDEEEEDPEPVTATQIAPRDLPNPLGTGSIPELLARIITIFTAIAGSVALLMFVYGGIMWLSSGGNKERIETGKKAVVYAVIGLAIIFGSYAILRALFTAIGARL